VFLIEKYIKKLFFTYQNDLKILKNYFKKKKLKSEGRWYLVRNGNRSYTAAKLIHFSI
jgi:hypothetical protein